LISFLVPSSEENRRIILEKIFSDDSAGSCREDSVWDIGVDVVCEMMGTVLWDLAVISLKSVTFKFVFCSFLFGPKRSIAPFLRRNFGFFFKGYIMQ